MKKYAMKYRNIIKPKQDVLLNCMTQEEENHSIETRNQAFHYNIITVFFFSKLKLE